jgi:DnaJ family protein C protein 7
MINFIFHEPTHQTELHQTIRQTKLDIKKAKRKDYYKILGVDKNASDDEIKKAFRKQALIWHPDKNRGDPEREKLADKTFKDIGEAYETLSDPKMKQRYDSGVDLNDDMEGFGGGHSHAGRILLMLLIYCYY